MIYCKRDDLPKYTGISNKIDLAIDAIMHLNFAELQMGQNCICDGIYGNRFDYSTQPEESSFYETHIRNADIHLVLSGEEGISIADRGNLKELECHPEEDTISSTGEKDAFLKLTREYVLIVFPGEAHKPKCMLGAKAQAVAKFVVKVPFD